MEKRYLLFFGEHYYPRPAWNCFSGAFETIEDAMAVGKENEWRGWWQIVDRDTLQAVSAGGNSYTGSPLPLVDE